MADEPTRAPRCAAHGRASPRRLGADRPDGSRRLARAIAGDMDSDAVGPPPRDRAPCRGRRRREPTGLDRVQRVAPRRLGCQAPERSSTSSSPRRRASRRPPGPPGHARGGRPVAVKVLRPGLRSCARTCRCSRPRRADRGGVPRARRRATAARGARADARRPRSREPRHYAQRRLHRALRRHPLLRVPAPVSELTHEHGARQRMGRRDAADRRPASPSATGPARCWCSSLSAPPGGAPCPRRSRIPARSWCSMTAASRSSSFGARRVVAAGRIDAAARWSSRFVAATISRLRRRPRGARLASQPAGGPARLASGRRPRRTVRRRRSGARLDTDAVIAVRDRALAAPGARSWSCSPQRPLGRGSVARARDRAAVRRDRPRRRDGVRGASSCGRTARRLRGRSPGPTRALRRPAPLTPLAVGPRPRSRTGVGSAPPGPSRRASQSRATGVPAIAAADVVDPPRVTYRRTSAPSGLPVAAQIDALLERDDLVAAGVVEQDGGRRRDRPRAGSRAGAAPLGHLQHVGLGELGGVQIPGAEDGRLEDARAAHRVDLRLGHRGQVADRDRARGRPRRSRSRRRR